MSPGRRIYEDEIRSVEGADARRAAPQTMWVDEDRLAAGALVLVSASDNACLVTLADEQGAGLLPPFR